jgi:hypothetical protein
MLELDDHARVQISGNDQNNLFTIYENQEYQSNMDLGREE